MTNSAGAAIRALLETARKGERTVIVGVLNITPDSFSDGGKFTSVAAAAAHAEQMVADGADILDIGGESTRPATFRSNEPLSAEEEMRRILPAISAVSHRFPHVPISVDTYKADVARAALEAGAVFINDISALRADPGMAALAVETETPVCLMHLPGLPTRVSPLSEDEDIVATVREHLRARADAAIRAGIARENIVVDPGFGFGKTHRQNLELLRRLGELAQLGYPLLVGTSRKSMIGKALGGLPSEDRLEGTAATVALAISYGASLVRVHDVLAMARVARMADAVVREGG